MLPRGTVMPHCPTERPQAAGKRIVSGRQLHNEELCSISCRRFLLIRENPACFAAANACPHSECVPCLHCAFHNRGQGGEAGADPSCGCGWATSRFNVVSAETYILKTEFGSQLPSMSGLRGVDAFYYERLIAMKLQHLALFLTLACFEIKQRNFRLAAVKQKRKIPVEARNIKVLMCSRSISPFASRGILSRSI